MGFSFGRAYGLFMQLMDGSCRPSRAFPCAAVAQVVERSPEKAGVGGSTPSRGTTFPRVPSLPVSLPDLSHCINLTSMLRGIPW